MPGHLLLKFFMSASGRKGLGSGCGAACVFAAAPVHLCSIADDHQSTCDKSEFGGHIWLNIETESESLRTC